MSSITQCPQCNTRFKVRQDQLDAHQGLVRCGRCQVVFNATHYLYDDEPSPQLDLPILLAETQPNGHDKYVAHDNETDRARFPSPLPSPTRGEGDKDSLREFHIKPKLTESTLDGLASARHEEQSPSQPSLHELLPPCRGKVGMGVEQWDTSNSTPSLTLPPQGGGNIGTDGLFGIKEDHTTLPDIAPYIVEQEEVEASGEIAADIQAENTEQPTLAQIALIEKPVRPTAKHLDKSAAKKRRWPWVMGCLLLSATVLAQAAYFFRIELAARLPGLKPVLISYCGLLQCTIPLPQKADQLSIESSDLEIADPTHANVITLSAILRNHAPYAQAYPDFELTLTDAQDKGIARRAFHPAEYLRPDEDEKLGLLPNRETSIKLHLDTTDLKPTGYRLFLFYPQ